MSDDVAPAEFVEQWRSQLTESLVHVARLAPQAPEVDFAAGLLATGVLWPVREPVQDFDGDAIDAIRAIAGAQSKHILRIVQSWDSDPLTAARDLAAAAAENPDLAEALAAVVAHFDAATLLSTRLDALPPDVASRIQAALVNIGGIINIQSFTLNVTHTLEIPPPPRPDRPPALEQFVGRRRELAHYANALAEHHLAVISGMAGVGKTALAATLARQTAQADAIFWHSFREREGIEVVIWKLAAFLAWHGQEELWRMLQSARQTGGQPPPLETLFDYLLPMLEGRAYLLCFDDLHWVEDDPLLIRLIERLRAALRAGRLALVITSRRVPTFVQTVKVESLTGLDAADARLLLQDEGVQLPDDLFDRLYDHTGGNAQFLVLALVVLRHEADPAGAIDRLAESDDIERYLLAEVEDRLTEQEQAVMGAVAVLLGYPAGQDAIEAVLDGERVRRTLRLLADRHLLLVREGAAGREYQQHAMVQAFYYDLLSRARRRAMHRRAAAFYETDEPDLLRAAIHHERGGDLTRSAQLATQDVWALINQGQMRSLRRLLEQFRADQLEPVDWINVKLALGQICDVRAEAQPARDHYQAALDRLEEMDASPVRAKLRAQVLRGMGRLVYNEQPQEALVWLRWAFDELAQAGDVPDPQTEAALYIDLAWAHRRLHNVPEALDALQRGLERLPREPSQLRGDALTRLVALYVAQFDLENARRYAQLAVENGRHLRDVWHEQAVLAMLGNIKHLDGDWPGAIQDYTHAQKLAMQIGDRAVHAAMEVNIGTAHANLGNTDLALQHLLDGLQLSRQSELRNYELKAHFAVAKQQMRVRQWDAAERHLDAAEELVEAAVSPDARFHLPLILSARAELRLLTGHVEAASSLAQRSIALAIEQEKHADLATCRRVMGQILIARGDYDRAVALLEQCLPPLAARYPLEAAKVKALLAQALHKSGDPARGEILLAEAKTTFTTLHVKDELMDASAWG